MTPAAVPLPELDEIARQAHACWCQSMHQQGWRPGGYDERAQTHDAMIPFDQLHKRDRLATLRAARYDAVEELAALVRYGRGPDRDFVLDEMKVGLLVVSADEQAEKGRVVDWLVDEEGELERIIVSWDDGGTSEHAAFSGELARPE